MTSRMRLDSCVMGSHCKEDLGHVARGMMPREALSHSCGIIKRLGTVSYEQFKSDNHLNIVVRTAC